MPRKKANAKLVPFLALGGILTVCVCLAAAFLLWNAGTAFAGQFYPLRAAPQANVQLDGVVKADEASYHRSASTAAGQSGSTTLDTLANKSFGERQLTHSQALAAVSVTPSFVGTPLVHTTPTPTSNLPPTYAAFDADFFGECPLFEGENDVRDYHCDYGEYDMLHKQATTRYSYYDADYGDAVIEGTGYLVKGTGDYEYGLVFRANADGTEYYVFTVTNDGKYNVALYKDSKYTDLIPYTASPAVSTGTGVNAFKVITRGSHFGFYLNGQFLGGVTDRTIPNGVTGFFFYNAEPNTSVGFDQLKISTFAPLTPTPAASETANPFATATPTVGATDAAPATPNATPSATPTLNPFATPTPKTYAAFDADFFDGPCPLFEGDNETREYSCGFGEYLMHHKEATTRYSYYDTEYDDGVVEADGYLVDGSGEFEYGIVFRANADGSEYYVFTVTDDGKYNVALYKDEKYTDLIPYTASPLVKTDAEEPNSFKVIMRGDTFDLYLNDEFLDTVTDDTIERGVAGLFFYNGEPDVTVGFDQLTVSTFTEPTPTPTSENAEPSGTPGSSLTIETPGSVSVATPAVTVAAPTAAIKPGVYVNTLRFAPRAPKRGEPITFYATFVNSTGKPVSYDWLVEIWEQDQSKKNPYGQADGLQREIPAGASELATGDSWKVAGGGPCLPFRARVVRVDEQLGRVPFKQTNGGDLWVSFQVCP